MGENLPKITFEDLFEQDLLGKKLWPALLGEKPFKENQELFHRFGRNAALATTHSDLADKTPPIHQSYSPQGDRVDEIHYHPSFQELQKLSYGAGLLSLKYQKDMLSSPHRHQLGFALSYYFAQTETGLFCPICMTDALGYVLENHQDKPIAQQTLKHLAQGDLSQLWQGAMFLTENQGGSDVGANTVYAEQEGELWRLYGDKWFCSNADADAILVLARMPGQKENGTKGLGLFLMLRTIPEQNHQNWQVNRLKDKLGVRSMASAEITLGGAYAHLIAGAGEGFKAMADMVNMSRLYNSISSLGIAKRALIEAHAFGKKRKAFGSTLDQLPLWRAGLSDLIAEHTALKILTFEAIAQLDQHNTQKTEESLAIMRFLTPLAKALCGKLSVFAASECMELIGGNAYIEEHILPRLLRDAQVLPIWEGTTNIQSLDALRALSKHGAQAIMTRLQTALSQSGLSKEITEEIELRFKALSAQLQLLATSDSETQQRLARQVLEDSGRIASLALVAELATKQPNLKEICHAVVLRLLNRPNLTAPLGGFHSEKMVSTEEVLLREHL